MTFGTKEVRFFLTGSVDQPWVPADTAYSDISRRDRRTHSLRLRIFPPIINSQVGP